MLGGVVGGGVLDFVVQRLQPCPDAAAWYVIGLFIGFFAYIVALRMKWDTLMATLAGQAVRTFPLFPWKH